MILVIRKRKNNVLWILEKCNDHDDENVHLILSFKRDVLNEFKQNQDKLKKVFKLEESKSCSVSNLHLFDPLGNIVKFKSVNGILKAFYKIRLLFYDKRKEYQTKFLKREIRYLKGKIRFVKGIIQDNINISKKSNKDILKELKDKHNFMPNPLNKKINVEPISKQEYENALEGLVHKYKKESKTEILSDSDSNSSSDEEEDVKDKEILKRYYLMIMDIF